MKKKHDLTSLTSRVSRGQGRTRRLAESGVNYVTALDEIGTAANPVLAFEQLVRETPRRHAEADDLARFERLVESLRPRLDLPRPATVLQALRNAEMRTAFLTEIGALTAAEVAQLAGSRASNTSALAGRWRGEGRIFAVPWGGELLYPAFQFAEGRPLPVIALVLNAFGEQSSAWEVAIWFVTPSQHLAGSARPVDFLDDPDALVAAAGAELDLPEF